MIIARTPRLLLRPFRADDADAAAMSRVFGDPEVMRFSVGGVRSPEWVRDWLRRWVDARYAELGFGLWAVVKPAAGPTAIGYCGLSRPPGLEDEIEVGYRLARDHWGRGLATEAAFAARDHAFDVLELPRIVALIDPANVASASVARKVGLRYERDLMLAGYDHSDHLYAMSRPARPPAPTQPPTDPPPAATHPMQPTTEIAPNEGNDHVQLCDLLKVAGLSESGGAAKQAIADGQVKVDGVVETRKRCKIRPGQTVEFSDKVVKVVARNEYETGDPAAG